MQIVILTALGVGGATVLGALLGFIFKESAIKYKGLIMSFSAGVMVFASVVGLILPAIELGGEWGGAWAVAGLIFGGFSVILPERLFSPLKRLVGSDTVRRRAVLMVGTIALHNLPEGIAAGVGFGSGDLAAALFIAGGIALQNIPEGCVVVAPLIGTGMSPSRAFLVAAATGLCEIFGTLLGFYAVGISLGILPFALSFAGGAMLYVIFAEMLPDIFSDGCAVGDFSAFLLGVCVMTWIS